MVTNKCWKKIRTSKDEIVFVNNQGRKLRVELGPDFDFTTGNSKRRQWDITIGSERNKIDEDIKTKSLAIRKARLYMKKHNTC